MVYLLIFLLYYTFNLTVNYLFSQLSLYFHFFKFYLLNQIQILSSKPNTPPAGKGYVLKTLIKKLISYQNA